jgi:hypothetical protein
MCRDVEGQALVGPAEGTNNKQVIIIMIII